MAETEPSQILQLIAALTFVLAIMGGLAFIVRRMGFAGAAVQNIGKEKRLKVVEMLPLDSRRKAVLLQRDNKQHLVILGMEGETVVETDIKPLKDKE